MTTERTEYRTPEWWAGRNCARKIRHKTYELAIHAREQMASRDLDVTTLDIYLCPTIRTGQPDHYHLGNTKRRSKKRTARREERIRRKALIEKYKKEHGLDDL